MLMLMDVPLPCHIEVGAELGEGEFCEFVAVGVPGAHTVWHHSRLPADVGRGWRVLSLKIVPRQDRPITIAVLDDNQASAAEVVEFFNANELHAHAFNSTLAVLEALKHRTYDGYIFDWRLSQSGKETAHELITHLRQDLKSTAPIFVLTGVDPNDEPVLNELEREITLNNIRLAFKPYKLRLLLTDLKLAIAATRGR
jgi:CheY-like chemotaxis protein